MKKYFLLFLFGIVCSGIYSQSTNEIFTFEGSIKINGNDTVDVVNVSISNVLFNNLVRVEFFEIVESERLVNSSLNKDLIESVYKDQSGKLVIEVPIIYHSHDQVIFGADVIYQNSTVSIEETVTFL